MSKTRSSLSKGMVNWLISHWWRVVGAPEHGQEWLLRDTALDRTARSGLDDYGLIERVEKNRYIPGSPTEKQTNQDVYRSKPSLQELLKKYGKVSGDVIDAFAVDPDGDVRVLDASTDPEVVQKRVEALEDILAITVDVIRLPAGDVWSRRVRLACPAVDVLVGSDLDGVEADHLLSIDDDAEEWRSVFADAALVNPSRKPNR